jgi:hypothetical protein
MKAGGFAKRNINHKHFVPLTSKSGIAFKGRYKPLCAI